MWASRTEHACSVADETGAQLERGQSSEDCWWKSSRGPGPAGPGPRPLARGAVPTGFRWYHRSAVALASSRMRADPGTGGWRAVLFGGRWRALSWLPGLCGGRRFRCRFGWLGRRERGPEMTITGRALPELLRCPRGARVLQVHLGAAPLATNRDVRVAHVQIVVFGPSGSQHDVAVAYPLRGVAH